MKSTMDHSKPGSEPTRSSNIEKKNLKARTTSMDFNDRWQMNSGREGTDVELPVQGRASACHRKSNNGNRTLVIEELNARLFQLCFGQA
uniref:Uncharacterized protein n=1 Tax=Nelumbo nucifera TaxID=4432 RepID=A0A822YAE6_NELNU|nr:TPA_asm: hypothetical protein HUJ06_029717 [Nelumbo nucifera]